MLSRRLRLIAFGFGSVIVVSAVPFVSRLSRDKRMFEINDANRDDTLDIQYYACGW